MVNQVFGIRAVFGLNYLIYSKALIKGDILKHKKYPSPICRFENMLLLVGSIYIGHIWSVEWKSNGMVMGMELNIKEIILILHCLVWHQESNNDQYCNVWFTPKNEKYYILP